NISVSPGNGAVGTVVTIGGQHFGAAQGASTLTFGGVAAAPIGWSDTSITAAVPSGVAPGNVPVVLTVQGLPNSTSFSVTPGISQLSPASGPVGTLLTISGSGFGAVMSNGAVWFGGGKQGTVASWADTSVSVAVPAGAATGNVVVCPATATSPYCSNGVAFTVQ